MKKPGRLVRHIAFAYLILTPLATFAGAIIQQPQLGYTLTLPEGWEQMPHDVIEKQMKVVAAIAGGQIQQNYDDGFQKSANGDWFRYPYVLVEVKKSGRVREGELKQMKSLRSGLQDGADSVSKKLNTIMSDMSLGDTYYDSSNKCILVRMSMKVANVGEIKAITCGFLTEKGMILFHCYAEAAEFDSLLPAFQTLLKSVKLSDDLVYTPRLGDSIGFDFGRVARSSLIGGIVGGLVGIVFWFKKKQQSKNS